MILPSPRRLIYVSGLRLYDHRVEWHGEWVPLSYRAFQVVETLARNPGQTLSAFEITRMFRRDGAYIRNPNDDRVGPSARNAVRKIRAVFRRLDPDFDEIECVLPHSYRWRDRGKGQPHPQVNQIGIAA